MIDLLREPFMQRALLAALVTGLAAPVIGTYLVQRRLALLGDGLGHVAVTGVALGLLTGLAPTWTAVVVAVLGAVAIEVIRDRGHTSGDLALALLFYGGLAGGVMITGLAGQSAATLQRYLFGSITSISVSDIWFTLGLALVIVVLGLGLLPQLFTVAQDQDFAKVAGLNVRAYNLLVAVLAAVTVTVAMRTVGLLLVSALMIVPVAASQQLARSFRATIGGAARVSGTPAAQGPMDEPVMKRVNGMMATSKMMNGVERTAFTIQPTILLTGPFSSTPPASVRRSLSSKRCPLKAVCCRQSGWRRSHRFRRACRARQTTGFRRG